MPYNYQTAGAIVKQRMVRFTHRTISSVQYDNAPRACIFYILYYIHTLYIHVLLPMHCSYVVLMFVRVYNCSGAIGTLCRSDPTHTVLFVILDTFYRATISRI